MDALEQVAQEERALGRNVHARQYDQSDEASILQLRDNVVNEFGTVHGLVNNAVARPMKSADAPLADWEASMQTNATGLFAITRAFGDFMAENGTGSIVNIGSIQGMVGPDLSLYEGPRKLSVARRFPQRARPQVCRTLLQCHVPPAHGQRQ